MNPISKHLLAAARTFKAMSDFAKKRPVATTAASLATVGVLSLVLASFGQSGQRTKTPAATLKKPVEYPLCEGYKITGYETAPAGSKVHLLGVNREKNLIQASYGLKGKTLFIKFFDPGELDVEPDTDLSKLSTTWGSPPRPEVTPFFPHYTYKDTDPKTARAINIRLREPLPNGHPRIELPAGTPYRVLIRGDGTKKTPALKHRATDVVLIGETGEQQLVEKGILETPGKTAGPPSVLPLQSSASTANTRTDGPPGIWTGVATGEEDIPSSDPAYEKRILELTNAERAKHGLAPLAWDENLARAARYQAGDMYVQKYIPANHASLDSFAGSDGRPAGGRLLESAQDRITRFATYGKGENAAFGPQLRTPERTVSGWMNSPEHRKNILTPRFRTLGVGFIRGTKDPMPHIVVVQVFGI